MSVTEGWSALLKVLEHAPSMSLSFRPAPARSEVERAESLTAAVWPDQLREFYSCHGGQSADDFGALLPMSELFGLERLLEEHRMMVEISHQWIEHDPEHFSPKGAADLAGAEAGVFLPAYIPIGGKTDGNSSAIRGQGRTAGAFVGGASMKLTPPGSVGLRSRT